MAALVAAPVLIDALTALDTHAHPGQLHHVAARAPSPPTFLRWFVIQIAAYGLFALGTALLNTRRRFVAVAWAPIVNNLVCIGILVWFGLWAGHGACLASVEQHHTQLVLLGLGTSLGVVLQGVALSRACAGPTWPLRWHWDLRDDALRTVVRLGGWTFGFVLANQIALFVVIVLAGSVAGPDPVSSYTYAYAFFQLPYGIIAVTVMSVVTPDLAEQWSTGQRGRVPHRMTGGLRAVLALIIPSAVGMLLLAKPAVACSSATGTAPRPRRRRPAPPWPCSPSGCPASAPTSTSSGCCSRCSAPRSPSTSTWSRTAQHRARRWCWCTPSACAASPCRSRSPTRWPPLLALAVFRQWFGRLGDARDLGARCGASCIACVPMGVVVLVVSNLSGSTSVAGLLARVVGAVVAGGVTFGAVVVWLGRRHDARRPPAAAPAGPSARRPSGSSAPPAPSATRPAVRRAGGHVGARRRRLGPEPARLHPSRRHDARARRRRPRGRLPACPASTS